MSFEGVEYKNLCKYYCQWNTILYAVLALLAVRPGSTLVLLERPGEHGGSALNKLTTPPLHPSCVLLARPHPAPECNLFLNKWQTFVYQPKLCGPPFPKPTTVFTSALSNDIVCLLAIATVFQLYHGGDMMYEMRRRKPEPTLLSTQ